MDLISLEEFIANLERPNYL